MKNTLNSSSLLSTFYHNDTFAYKSRYLMYYVIVVFNFNDL